MTSVYDDIRSDLLQVLEGVDVLNNTDIGHLNVDGLTESARLAAILNRRLKRLCINKLDEVKTIAEMHASIEWGQRLMGKDTGYCDVSARHKSLLNSQHALEKYTTHVKT